MQNSSRVSVLAALVVTATVYGGASAAREDADGQGILLRLVDDAGHTATVVVGVAGKATVTKLGLPTLQLRASLAEDSLLNLQVSIDGTQAAYSDTLSAGVTYKMASGETTHVNFAGYVLDILWDGVTAAGSYSLSDSSPGSLEECCVVCDGMKMCACRVTASCGACCAEKCGGCGTGPG